jgi:hypothetical protein
MKSPWPVNDLTQPVPIELRRAGWFTIVLLTINLVGDGWARRLDPLSHQLLLVPVTLLFLCGTYQLLAATPRPTIAVWATHRALLLAFGFEMLFALIYRYEGHHFAGLGYRLHPLLAAMILMPALLLLGLAAIRRLQSAMVLVTALAAYAGGIVLAIVGFPLNYMRSDMLPVILWADQYILRHLDPYTTMHVGDRLYDFPYLPGMMLASLPFTGAHLDIRFGSIAYIFGSAGLLYWAASRDRRLEVTALLTCFILCPYLQFRHELYLQPHWFALIVAFVLMQRRRFAWAAVAFGVGMAIYQFSWILFPFFLLNALRRRGWLEALKLAVLGALGALAIVGPFLASASRRIASNTVGQWGLLPHAVAPCINLSYWATYLVRPDRLLRLQAVLMIVIFLYCFARRRCADLADTLRWMVAALAVFILFNVIVDGYFYLLLLVVMLVYTCIANGWLDEPSLPTETRTATVSSSKPRPRTLLPEKLALELGR